MSPNWFLNMASPILNIPAHLFFMSVFIGKLFEWKLSIWKKDKILIFPSGLLSIRFSLLSVGTDKKLTSLGVIFMIQMQIPYQCHFHAREFLAVNKNHKKTWKLPQHDNYYPHSQNMNLLSHANERSLQQYTVSHHFHHMHCNFLTGLMPYNFICVQTGGMLSQIQSLDDIFTPWTLAKLAGIAVMALVPGVIVKKLKDRKLKSV